MRQTVSSLKGETQNKTELYATSAASLGGSAEVGRLAHGGFAMNEVQLYSMKSKPLVALINVRGEVSVWDDKCLRPRRVFKFGQNAQEASWRLQERGWRVFSFSGKGSSGV
jgi:hypothetical protein